MAEDNTVSYQTGESEVNFLSILWAAASEPLASHDKAVCQALIDSLNPGAECGKFADYDCYGEELFIKCILDKLENAGLLEFINPKIYKHSSGKPAAAAAAAALTSKTLAKLSKADTIKRDNEFRLISQKIDTLLRTFKMKAYEIDMIARQRSQLLSSYLEIRGISLLYITWSLLHFHENDTIELEFVYGVIIGLQKFISVITKHHQQQFSSTLLAILTKQCDLVEGKYNYNVSKLYAEMPKLIMESPLDEFLPCMTIKPHQHQLDVLNVISTRMEPDAIKFCTYRMGTGAGKTFSALLLAEKIRRIRVASKYEANVRFIYCSAIPSVRRRAAQLFHSFEIPFGFALPVSPEIRRKRNLRGSVFIDFSYACRSNAECVALICSPETAIKLMAERGEDDEEKAVTENRKFNFVLFLDEINYGAEVAESRELIAHMKLIKHAPKWMIVASATLASDSALEPMLEVLSRRYTTVNHIDIHSNIIYGCSNVQTFNGSILLPHHDCKTVSELKAAFDKISGNLFLCKMYNPTVLLALQRNMKRFIEWSLGDDDEKDELEAALSKLPDIEEIFGDISNLYADNIRKIAMDLLKFMIDFDDDYMVEVMCKPVNSNNELDFSKLGSTLAHKFLDSNLIVSENPIEFAMSAFSDVLKTIKSRIGSFNKIYNNYETAMTKWKQAFDKLEDTIIKADDLSMAQDEMRDSLPSLEFPSDLQINTFNHIRRIIGDVTAASLSKGARVPINLETLPFDKLNVSEDVILLLCAGIGIYVNPNNKSDLNPNYIKTVLDLAANGRLVYLIGDGSLAYGLDMPFASVTICKDFSDKHSLNTINQLMSRAGRGKMSFMSKVFMDVSCSEMILASIRDNFIDVEMMNMADVLRKI